MLHYSSMTTFRTLVTPQEVPADQGEEQLLGRMFHARALSLSVPSNENSVG
jgi:hypothetical protein